MSSIEKVLIVGGGIAGLTAAAALGRQGIACEVLELHDRLAGAAITIQNRAIDGLHEIGVLERFMAEGLPRSSQEFFAYFDAAGEPLPTPPIPPRETAELPQAIVIHRVQLAQILREAAERAGAVVRTGMSISALEQDADTITATLTDGSRRSVDLVVGADGVRSHTRDLLFGDAVVPRYSGSTMFRWVIADAADLGPMGFYQSERLIVVQQLRGGSIYLATGRQYAEPPGRIEQDAARRIVAENLSCFTAPLLTKLRRRLDADAKIIVNDYNWLMTPDPWSRGRAIVIGDAAHATTAALASGGGMAIEDAVVLSDEVSAGGSVDDILGRFMKRRFERTRLVVDTSVELDRMMYRHDPVAEQNALRGRATAALTSPY